MQANLADPIPALSMSLGDRYVTFLVPSLGEEVQVQLDSCASNHKWDPDSQTLAMTLIETGENVMLQPLSYVHLRVSATLDVIPPQLTATLVPPSQSPAAGLQLVRK